MGLNAVHVGDLHFWSFSRNPLAYVGKRTLGIGNLALRRARAFRKEHAPQLVARLEELNPDWLLLSGDFTTTSLPAEFAQALDALAPLLRTVGERTVAVPGNHDRYTRRDIRRATFEAHAGPLAPRGGWPHFRDLGGGLWVVALDATTSNGVGSHGRFTAAHAEALDRWWEEKGDAVRELWLLCHFPAEEPKALIAHDRGPQLLGAERLVRFLERTGVPVLHLHGHHHHRWLYRGAAAPNVLYCNAGAPLLVRGRAAAPDLGFLQLVGNEGATAIRCHRRPPGHDSWIAEDVPAPQEAGEWIDLQRPKDEGN